MLLSLLITMPAYAGVVTPASPISFGSIDLHPSGDAIIIDARNGATSPIGKRSVVTGGGEGQITIISTGSEQAIIDYPSSSTLSDGNYTVTIKNIDTYSQYSGSFIDLSAPQTVKIYIGGELVLPKGTRSSNYTGSLIINVTFHML